MTRPSILYVALVAVAAALALAEWFVSRRHERRLLASGGEEVGHRVFRLMAPVYVLQFPACLAEHLGLDRRPTEGLFLAMAGLFVVSKALKYWAMRHLGAIWTMKVVLPPGPFRVVSSGPYRYIRHPNYVAVVGEILGLALAGACWWTGGIAAALFVPLLVSRVRTEERTLRARSDYATVMGERGRFVP